MNLNLSIFRILKDSKALQKVDSSFFICVEKDSDTIPPSSSSHTFIVKRGKDRARGWELGCLKKRGVIEELSVDLKFISMSVRPPLLSACLLDLHFSGRDAASRVRWVEVGNRCGLKGRDSVKSCPNSILHFYSIALLVLSVQGGFSDPKCFLWKWRIESGTVMCSEINSDDFGCFDEAVHIIPSFWGIWDSCLWLAIESPKSDFSAMLEN